MSDKPKSWSWLEWQEGRYRRRMIGRKITSAEIRRSESKDDARLRGANNGERGPAFATDAELFLISQEAGKKLQRLTERLSVEDDNLARK